MPVELGHFSYTQTQNGLSVSFLTMSSDTIMKVIDTCAINM